MIPAIVRITLPFSLAHDLTVYSLNATEICEKALREAIEEARKRDPHAERGKTQTIEVVMP